MGDGVARWRRPTGHKTVETRVVRLVCVFAAVTLMVIGFGSGLASAADPLIGKKYSDAAAWVSKRGTPVVATVSGSQLPLDECIVVSWSKGGFLNNSGKNDRRNEYYLNLNCNNAVAYPGHPGNSVMTTEGARAKNERDAALRIKDNPTWCERNEKNLSYCERICAKTGLCKVES